MGGSGALGSSLAGLGTTGLKPAFGTGLFDTSFAGATQISNSQVDHLSCSPHNDALLLTGDTEEISFWDIRNLSKPLFNVKSGPAYQMEFSLVSSNIVWLSRDAMIEAISLVDWQPNSNAETNGLKVSSIVRFWRTCVWKSEF